MSIKDELKKKIDNLPEEIIEEVFAYIEEVQKKEIKTSMPRANAHTNTTKANLPFYNLGKELDKVDFRKSAYEE